MLRDQLSGCYSSLSLLILGCAFVPLSFYIFSLAVVLSLVGLASYCLMLNQVYKENPHRLIRLWDSLGSCPGFLAESSACGSQHESGQGCAHHYMSNTWLHGILVIFKYMIKKTDNRTQGNRRYTDTLWPHLY